MNRMFYRFFAPKEGDGDTSENDSKESSDSDEEQNDNEEDSSEDDTEEQDNDKDDEGEEGIAKKYFADPNSLDPKLRADFKKMQGIFTRRMQEASAVVKRAEAFDLLVQDPSFQKWAQAKRGGTLKNDPVDNDTEDDDSEDTPITKKDLAKLMQRIEQKETRSKQDADMQTELAQFKKDYPDYKIYAEGMKQVFSKYPDMSYEDAYKLTSHDDIDSEARIASVKAKKNANINKPNKTGAKEGTPKKGKMSFSEAFEMAKKSFNKK